MGNDREWLPGDVERLAGERYDRIMWCGKISLRTFPVVVGNPRQDCASRCRCGWREAEDLTEGPEGGVDGVV